MSLERERPAIATVVKVGGSVLAHPELLSPVLGAIEAAARESRLVVVPGGGPFADAVRAVDRRVPLSEDAAHWMAVLAMDQYANLIAALLEGSALVAGPEEIDAALDAGRVPVLAPSRWLREADPLPHSWDVTSDSIAAWVAKALGAPRLVLVKPPGIRVPDGADRTASPGRARGELVDAWFSRVLPAEVAAVLVPADRVEDLRAALAP